MSVQFDYLAIPPSSTLFQRLLTDKAFVYLMCALSVHGPSVFFFFDDIAPDERNEILGWINENRELGDEPEAKRLIDEFRLELERTRLAYPGIRQRRSSLEESVIPILVRTSEALRHVQDDAKKFVTELMTGREWLPGINEDFGYRPCPASHGAAGSPAHRRTECRDRFRLR